ncbi:unnamed protein product [Effrenium voratum]|uniref:Reverse transcriptase Ty1/copia-type domain-containing protein n=1 Tax=Effrenium voratum TaxID=2562239 RepID=A0AA36HN45_9DINO|nr:unnamed protein product [Effrenium voratum]
MEDAGKKNDSGLLQACVYVPSQINSMSMVRGFTPQQWVTGKNPNQVQSLTGEIFSPTVSAIDEAGEFAAVQQKRLAAQMAFLKANSDARLRRAMNQNYRQIKDDVVIGQVVYYCREKGAGILQKQKWRGPARVVATEKDSDYKDLVIWLAHGTSFLRCSPHQVRPRVEETGISLVADPNAALRDLQALRARSTTQYKDVFDPTIREDQDEDELDAAFDEEASPTSPTGPAEVIPASEPEPLPPPEVGGRDPASSDGRQSSQPAQPSEPRAPDGRDEQQDLWSKRQKTAQASDAPVDVPVPMQDDDDLMLENVTLVGGAEPDLRWVIVDGEFELDEAWLVKSLRKNEACEKNMTVDQRAQMMEAKKAELENYFRNQVWNFAEVNPGDESRIVSARWVLTWKETEGGGPRAKARLVLRGFEDPDLLYFDKASPTAGRLGKNFLLLIVQNNRWHLYVGDVRAAFLSGSQFDRKIIVKLPSDCGPLLGVVGPAYMRLLKSAYGLADAPLLWYKEATSRLQLLNFIQHRIDYYKQTTGEMKAILIVHVDDILLGADMRDKEVVELVRKVRASFDFGKWKQLQEKEPIVYCGGAISIQNGEIEVSFADYLRKVMPITVNNKDTGNLTDKEVSKRRALLGALQWPAGQAAPHLCASTSILAGDIAAKERSVLNEGIALCMASAKGTHC